MLELSNIEKDVENIKEEAEKVLKEEFDINNKLSFVNEALKELENDNCVKKIVERNKEEKELSLKSNEQDKEIVSNKITDIIVEVDEFLSINDNSKNNLINLEAIGENVENIIDFTDEREMFLKNLKDRLFKINELLKKDIEIAECKNSNIDINNAIRDVLDSSARKQVLPSIKKVDWSDENKIGNSNCVLKDEAVLFVNDKSTGIISRISGYEFKKYMKSKFGQDYVTYIHREPDFRPFEMTIDKNDFEELYYSKYGKIINISNIPEGHINAKHLFSDRKLAHKFANEEYLKILGNGIKEEDLKDYMRLKNLTWHECGDNTIRLVPSEMNQIFKHTGAIGLSKDLISLNEISFKNEKFTLVRKKLSFKTTGTANGLDAAIRGLKKAVKEKKKELFNTNK